MKESEKVNYFELPGLENIYFEDSYVLNIETNSQRIAFTLECVLTEQHPLYKPNPSNEHYCYRQGILIFPNVVLFHWLEYKLAESRTIDTDGSVDYGTIDIFYQSGNMYYLEGSWGKILIESGVPILSFS